MDILSMTFRKALFTFLGLTSVCAAQACGSDSTPAATPPPPTGCDTIDYASYKTGAAVSLMTDVMPIFGGSCTASDCHNSHDHKAGLDLGVRCQPSGSGATYSCAFPTVDPDPSLSNPPKPLTQAIVDATHASLMLPSTTVKSPTVARVVPGDPEHSFIIQKVTDKQAQPGYTCENQDPTHTTNPVPCGALMPLNSSPLCEGTSRARFGLLAPLDSPGRAQQLTAGVRRGTVR
jgi:hypothetical protein